MISFLIFFWYLHRLSTQPAKPSKTLVFTMHFNGFTLQKNMIVHYFPDLFPYQFWHWFPMHFGIGVGSILASVWHQFSYRLVIRFYIDYLWKCDQQWLQKGIPGNINCQPFVRDLFPHSSIFYSRETYKCQKLRFQFLPKTKKKYPHAYLLLK